jgi:glycerophosphoryl diester phosphodiesterase
MPRFRPALVLLLTLLSAGCMDHDRPFELIAHRGASADAPENTLAAFRLAWQQGADAIEGDFRLTADGELVCLHDRTTKRTAGVERVAAESTLEQLRELEYGAWKGPGWRGEPLPTLLEVMRTVPRQGRIYVELKGGPETVPAVRAALGRSGLRVDQVVVIAFDARTVEESKRTMPPVKAYWLTDFEREGEGWKPGAEEVLATLERCLADGLDAEGRPEALTEELRAGLRERRLDLAAWTVDDAARARELIALGVSGITTNRPQDLRAALED